jgi:hypothetical protein
VERFYDICWYSKAHLSPTLQRVAFGMLAVLSAGLFASEEDAEGYVFIDRDPSHFIAVLTYLREGPSEALNMVEKAERRALNRELRFYGLPEIALKRSTVAVLTPKIFLCVQV